MHLFPIEIQDSTVLFEGLRATKRFFEVLASTYDTYKGATMVVTHLDSPFLNIAFLGELSTPQIHDVFTHVAEFYQHYQIPWSVVVTPLSSPSNLAEYLIQEKFGLLESVPCMYCDLSTQNIPQSQTEIVIEELLSSDDLLGWIQPIVEGFEAEDNGEAFRQLNLKIAQQEGILKQFVVYVDGKSVTSGTLFLFEDIAMIHNIATKTAELKKGYATALTRHLMKVAKDLGYKHCFLESSESGYNLYRQCGFRVYGVNHYYVKKQ